ncbi:hypothetical protein [Desulfogranum japonicum]|uniref:hypothetical protein n=1 Tax=Desulfogranum japonicum TaxID=231447 RepID=UPI000401555B|nr:hypothetical protein [Desulfogranum japonicum]
MKARERLDKIINSCQKRIQDEVSALLGKEIIIGQPVTAVHDKEACFDEVIGKTVVAHLQFEGEIEGQGAIMVSIQDAIRVGGTLIMLPESELQLAITDENYSEELQDSYGEIANIISGSLTSAFEEQFPKSFRIVRTEQEVLTPTKVDIDSEQPFPPAQYHHTTFSMSMAGNAMGNLHLVLAAAPLGLADAVADDLPEQEEAVPEEPAAQPLESEASPAEEPVSEEKEEAPQKTTAEPTAATTPKPKSPKDLQKQKKLIDGLLKLCADKVGEEVTALVGDQLKLNNVTHNIYTKEEVLEIPQGKQALTRMDIRGDKTGEAYLLVNVSSAIFMGGSLIMLPEQELDETVRNEVFGDDAQDAFGEIANIIAGVYTSVFEEQYRKKIGFVKTTMETLIPVKVDPDSDDIMPNQLYYATSGEVVFAEKEMGTYVAVFPAVAFDLEGLAAADEEEVKKEAKKAPSVPETPATEKSVSQEKVEATGGTTGPAQPAQPLRQPDIPPDILIFSDDPEEGRNLTTCLSQLGYHPRELAYKSSVTGNLNTHIRLVFIIMKEVSEQGFGVAIKVSSAGYQVPLIVAGPAWTRTLVIKAVKYGADDILVTPSMLEDVQAKVEMNLGKIAA